jgi:hypothetical protein
MSLYRPYTNETADHHDVELKQTEIVLRKTMLRALTPVYSVSVHADGFFFWLSYSAAVIKYRCDPAAGS